MAKLLHINTNNLNDYTYLLLEISSSISNPKMALNQTRIIKQTFIETVSMLKEQNTRFDYHYYFRVFIDDDNKPIGFLSGLLRYFEAGAFLQIGNFGISRRYQRKQQGKIFCQLLESELRSIGVNYMWGIMKNPIFWEKQGFIKNSSLILPLYSNVSSTDNIYVKPLESSIMSLESFLSLLPDLYQ